MVGFFSIAISGCMSQEEFHQYVIKQILGDTEQINSSTDNSPRPKPIALPTEIPVPTETPEPIAIILPTETPVTTRKPVPTETPTPMPTPTPTPTPVILPTATAIPTPTLTPTPLPTPTEIPTPIPTSTPEPTETPLPTETPEPTATSTPIPTPTPNPYREYFIYNVNLGLDGGGIEGETRVVNLSGVGVDGLDNLNDVVYVYLQTEQNEFPLISTVDTLKFLAPGTDVEIRGLVVSVWTQGNENTATVIKVERRNKVGVPDVWKVDPNFAGGRGPKNYRGLVDISIKVKKY